ncbi:FadR/GntR family transcriptional regulator [Pseudokineococcus sp. 1T1Z-3]|uniref:FadR/GntR family transcriptional regulator n=1 Tax=Pseudokineococcus sp. 1T1Z-3 TaxID=3132745 RepID=UPI00309EDE59
MSAGPGEAPDGWQRVRKVRTYEQVMGQIERQIDDGTLRAGDRLPSERELSALLGISRPSLREALRVLEGLGVVDVRPGGGSAGGAVLVAEPGGGFATLLTLQLALGHFSDHDVLHTRVALESWVAEEAAQRVQPEQVATMSALLDRMDDPAIAAAEFNALDAEFHVQLARASGNALTSHLMASLRTAIRRRMEEAYDDLPDWRATAVTVRAEHRAILAAVADHDEALAVTRMREHLETFWSIGSGGRAG